MRRRFFQSLLSQGGAAALAAQIYVSHNTRVVADGGVIDSEADTKAILETLIMIYGINTEAEFKSRIPISLYPSIFGYKVGSGSGITADMGCRKLYSVNENYDIVQETAANQLLLLAHNGENYYYAPRVSANDHVETTNHTVTSYDSGTDTIRFTAKVFLNNQTTTSFDDVFKSGGGFRFQIRSEGTSKRLQFRSTSTATLSSLYAPSSTQPHWIRYIIDLTNVIYQWSSDGVNFTTISTVARPTMGVFSSTNRVCDTAISTVNVTRVYHAVLENVTQALTCTFDPSEFNRVFSPIFWQGTDCDWTIRESTATTGLKGHLVDYSVVQGDGVGLKLANASIALDQPHTSYLTVKQNGTGVFYGLAAASQVSNDAVNSILNNGAALSVADTIKITKLITSVSNGASSEIIINNDTTSSGDAGANNASYLEVGGNGASYGNFTLKSLIIVDNAA